MGAESSPAHVVMTMRSIALRIATLTALAAGVASCNSHPLQPLGDVLDGTRIEQSDPIGSNAVDIIWVIDNSGSMREEQQELGEKFDAFIDELAELGADFHISVITTDVRDVSQRGRFQGGPGNVVSEQCRQPPADLAYCADLDLARFFLDADSYRNGDDLDRDRLTRDFRCLSFVGDCGTPYEAGLEALERSVSDELIDNDGFNSDFLRDDAFLAVIFLTDEDDCSTVDTFNPGRDADCYVDQFRDNLLSVQRVYDRLVELKDGDESRVLVAGIIGPDDGREPPTLEEYNRDGPRPSCNSALGGSEGTQSARDGERYRSLIDLAMERGIEESICQGDFTVALREIGNVIRTNLDVNCLQDTPETCETSADCPSGVDCVNPGDPAIGSAFCASFEILLEVSTPEEPLIFNPLVGPGPAGNTEPLADRQFSVDYDSATCNTGVSFGFEQGARPRPGARYRVSYPVEVDVRTRFDEEQSGGTGGETGGGELSE